MIITLLTDKPKLMIVHPCISTQARTIIMETSTKRNRHLQTKNLQVAVTIQLIAMQLKN